MRVHLTTWPADGTRGGRWSFLARLAGPGFPWMDRWCTTARAQQHQQLRYAAGLAHAPSIHHRLLTIPCLHTYVLLNLNPHMAGQLTWLTCIVCIYRASLQLVKHRREAGTQRCACAPLSPQVAQRLTTSRSGAAAVVPSSSQ